MEQSNVVPSVVSVDLVRASYRNSGFPAGWSDEKRKQEAERYQRLLVLARENPGQPLAPTRDIDEMWHLHMLHPKAYYEDCMRLFGEIFDHDGGFGMEADELPVLQQTFAKTQSLYEQRFGSPYADQDQASTSCWHNCQSRCWHACSSK